MDRLAGDSEFSHEIKLEKRSGDELHQAKRIEAITPRLLFPLLVRNATLGHKWSEAHMPSNTKQSTSWVLVPNRTEIPSLLTPSYKCRGWVTLSHQPSSLLIILEMILGRGYTVCCLFLTSRSLQSQLNLKYTYHLQDLKSHVKNRIRFCNHYLAGVRTRTTKKDTAKKCRIYIWYTDVMAQEMTARR